MVALFFFRKWVPDRRCIGGLGLERRRDGEADAVFGGGGEVEVVEAADVLNLDETEDVLHTDGILEIGLLAVHDVAVCREVHQQRARLVPLQIGIVAFGETAPEGLELQNLAQLQLAQQGDAVEDLAAHLPGEHQRGETVVEELDIVDHVEQLRMHDVGEVGLWHRQQGPRYLVPLLAQT